MERRSMTRKKQRGRASKGTLIGLRLPSGLLARVDRWAASPKDDPSGPEAIAAEAQAVTVVGDKTELSTAACAAILRSRHETALRLEVGHAMLSGARVNRATNSSHRPTSTASALCACLQR